MAMDSLKQEILRTLIYFDVFKHPLTLVEIYKWLNVADCPRIKHADSSQMTPAYLPAQLAGRREWLADIEESLSQMSDKVGSKDGFYFLKGRDEIVQTRLSRYNISEEKFKRARKFIKVLRFIPFIKCLIVVNRLGYSNVHQNSDIDLAAIVKKNRLWLTRFLAVGLLSVLKVRPRQINRALAIDLNFFISEDKLNLESLVRSEAYVFPYWLNQFIPVYDDGVFGRFISENQWLKKYLPNSFAYQLNQRRTVSTGPTVESVKWLIGLLIDWDFMERWAEKYQWKIMPTELKSLVNQDREVIINKEMLKFHQGESWRNLKVVLEERMAEMSI